MALTAKKVYAILKRQISDMEAKLNSPVRYRGTVATADLLPLNPDIGDMYNIESKSVYGEAGMNVAWNGVVWDTMGAPIDMSLYIKSSELADWVKQQNKPTYTAEEVGALPADTKIPSKTSDLQNDSGFLTKIPDNYLSETDKTLNVSGKAADAKATGDKITELSADISNKLNKNQGSENSGKIAGINESGDIVPMFPVSVDYNEETNCLEFGSDQKMELNKGINLDSTLTKTGYAADAGAVGEITNSLKEDISTKITKFYASSQGETHLADSDNGKITDMVLYGRSEQKQYSGKNLVKATLESTTKNGITCTNNGDGTYTLNGTANGGDDTTVSFNVGHMIAKSGKYIVVGCPKGGSSEKYNLRIGKDNIPWGTYVNSDLGNGCLINVTDNTPITLNLMIKDGYTCNNVIFKPMIVDASLYPDTAYDDFEPYTGGIPSPSPDYPQEIKSVVNPTVKVCGKNLLEDGSLKSDNNGKIEYISAGKIKVTSSISAWYAAITNTLKLTPNTNYVLSAKCDSSNGNITCNSVSITGAYIKCAFLTDSDGLATIAIRCRYESAESRFVYSDLQLEKGSTATAYEPYTEQTVALPYTLNVIPVNSGGNVTIDGQQYIADYVDVERGKRIKMVGEVDLGSLDWTYMTRYTTFAANVSGKADGQNMLCSMYINYGTANLSSMPDMYICANSRGEQFFIKNSKYTDADAFKQAMSGAMLYYELATPEEIDLTTEEIKAFELLQTYYPTTNISVNSEQLDGYTIFNYPISMENGWNYVKQQIGDTRDYIYDMDARAQDTDLQAAEAYVNSEYAVALTELEV